MDFGYNVIDRISGLMDMLYMSMKCFAETVTNDESGSVELPQEKGSQSPCSIPLSQMTFRHHSVISSVDLHRTDSELISVFDKVEPLLYKLSITEVEEATGLWSGKSNIGRAK